MTLSGITYIANNVLGNPTYTDPVLYSGGEAARTAAESYATTNGSTMLGDTIIGKTAESLEAHLPMLKNFIWQGASELFCQQSTGNVYALISNSGFDMGQSIFWNNEMPILLNKFTEIAEIIIEIF